jgi:putative membrane protein
MLVEILLALFIGILAGTFTGVTPGIHTNLICAMLIAASVFLLNYFTLHALAVFIISMSVTHSFVSVLPSIFLGAPDSLTALGVLPGHRYLLHGNGLMAVKLTIIGSLGSLILSILTYPLLYLITVNVYDTIKNYVGFILIAITLFMILRDRLKLWSLFIFLLSGCIGIIVLSWPNLRNPLFPLLSGLFGVSTLLISIKDKNSLPEQKILNHTELNKKNTIKALLSGQFSGFLTAVLPGIGSGTAAVLSLQITRKLGDSGFMILIGSISTANFILSLITFQALNKARNGSIVAIQSLLNSITLNEVFLFILTALIAGSIASIFTLKIGKFFSKFITKINYKILIISIVSSIFILAYILSGYLGIVILIVSTFIGIIPAIVKAARVHSMGCLILPVIFYFVL